MKYAILLLLIGILLFSAFIHKRKSCIDTEKLKREILCETKGHRYSFDRIRVDKSIYGSRSYIIDKTCGRCGNSSQNHIHELPVDSCSLPDGYNRKDEYSILDRMIIENLITEH